MGAPLRPNTGSAAMDSSPAPPLVTWFLVPPDLFVGPTDPVLAAGLDPLLATPFSSSKKEDGQ